jgi:hypothetical protein
MYAVLSNLSNESIAEPGYNRSLSNTSSLVSDILWYYLTEHNLYSQSIAYALFLELYLR